MFRLILLLSLISSFGACSLGGGAAPQDHYYRLPEIVLDKREESLANSFKNIVIKPVKSTGLYHERAILFIESDKPLELQRYHYSFWSTTPAELAHNALFQGLQSSGITQQITRQVSETRPDYIIDTRIIQFERFLEAETTYVNVALEVFVRSGDASGPGWTKRYSVNQKLLKNDMHTTAEAFGEAFREISSQLVNDLLSNK